MRSFSLLLVLAAGALRASTINGCPTGTSGAVNVFMCFAQTPSPFNDNVTGVSPNQVTYGEFFTGAGSGLARFTLTDGAATEYVVSKRIRNDTGVTWTGFEVYFGTGSLTNQASTSLYQFDFDQAPSFAAILPGSTVTTSPHLIQWSDISVAPGEFISIAFAIDIGAGATGEWWIEQQAVAAPEPATGALGLLALAFIAARRRAARS